MLFVNNLIQKCLWSLILLVFPTNQDDWNEGHFGKSSVTNHWTDRGLMMADAWSGYLSVSNLTWPWLVIDWLLAKVAAWSQCSATSIGKDYAVFLHPAQGQMLLPCCYSALALLLLLFCWSWPWAITNTGIVCMWQSIQTVSGPSHLADLLRASWQSMLAWIFSHHTLIWSGQAQLGSQLQSTASPEGDCWDPDVAAPTKHLQLPRLIKT